MMNKLYKQRGGTLLGIIIGLIAGLGIAIVVALMITKSSTPISNKNTRSDKVTEQPAAQASDPNKPLYGKQDAVKEFVKESSPATAGTPAAPAKTETKQATKIDSKPEAKPAQGKPAADKQNKDAAANQSPSDDKWIYYLQTGAYRDQDAAENARAKLALLGFEARISEMPSQGQTVYRLRIGPFPQVATMNRIRSKLSDSGVDAAVVRIPK